MTKLKNGYLMLALIGLNGYAQELVPNSSFEEYTALPSDGQDWDDCVSWTNAGGDHDEETYHFGPDYFHTDAEDDWGLQLPDLAFADLSAHSGNAIMGFVGYRDPEFYESETVRSYLSIGLNEAMEIGNTYTVSFWISNGESGHGFRYKCDGIGILFSTSELDQSGANYIDREPQYQIEEELFITRWEQYTFEFVADSAYTQLTIGNFFSDEETNVSLAVEGPLPFNMAYYFCR